MTPFTVTFYSYKGGVGRTLLAANVAVELSRRGKTLLWDLDIEAPGLHRIERIAPGSPAPAGLFEWLIEWQDKRKLDDLTPRDTDKLIASIRATQGATNLHVLAAHGVDADVAGLYQQIDWHRFFVREPERGIKLLKVLLEAFHCAGYERVIIDSRTGITDIGGLLVALVPHVTVLMGNFGVQNTAGLTAIWKALQGAADPNKSLIERIVDAPLTRLLVASPIPTGDPAKAGELLARWAKDFGADIKPIEIPFDERLRYREELLALTNPDSPTAQAYKRLATQLGAIESQRIQDAEAQESALRERPDLLPRGSRSTPSKAIASKTGSPTCCACWAIVSNRSRCSTPTASIWSHANASISRRSPTSSNGKTTKARSTRMWSTNLIAGYADPTRKPHTRAA